MKTLKPTKNGVIEEEYNPDVFIILEVGRALTLPDYINSAPEVKKVSSIKALTPNEIPEVSKRLYDLINSIPLNKKVALVLSGPLALTALFFAFQGIHRTMAVGQFNPSKSDYDWYLVEPDELRNFFLV
ncbi:MAG: hypothetical protein HA495_00380 [Thaumarchaeota archaeon]|jgi:hypothetical protein|nr:hypothetical protein [Nitrososphaerota archaeon]